jgi:isopentenyl-diphosphate delta-isomerase
MGLQNSAELGQLRKNEHLDFCQRGDVEASDRFTGFEAFSFLPYAISGLSMESLDTQTSFLGQRFSAPFLITGMTGGVAKGHEINRRLAQMACAQKIPMGIGSQRVALENPACRSVFQLKNEYPSLFLIGNLGVAQLLHPKGVAWCQEAVDMIGADALAIHLNVVQECIQPEGDRRFIGVRDKIAEVCARLSVPVLVKEVGAGLDIDSANQLLAAGVTALDVGGRGGTSWPYIEGLRSQDPLRQELAGIFRNWGIPTAYSLHALRQAHVTTPLVATGGIRSGLTAAKALALGANMVGIGLPLMQAALESAEQVEAVFLHLLEGLKITMLATGSPTISHLASRLCMGHPYEMQARQHFTPHGDR